MHFYISQSFHEYVTMDRFRSSKQDLILCEVDLRKFYGTLSLKYDTTNYQILDPSNFDEKCRVTLFNRSH